ncbi:MAG: 2-oxo acid dehydrogenase subunit E2 [Verrucomicrobia bacterium]|nr:2-oxo acid dehydrogenase subunit E2 [Verrucomicrobiota bacterium]
MTVTSSAVAEPTALPEESLLTPEQQRHILTLMLESRHGDLRQESLNRQGKGHFHVSGMGHECMAVLGAMMGPDDMASMYYRDRSFLIGRGVTTRELALDYFAKRESSTGGRQMPAHGTYKKFGLWSVSTPTGAQLLPACGMAWGMQMDGKDSFCVTSIGDAATRQGDFYEAVCFARERLLPVLFVVEDNGFGISSRTRKINPLVIGALSPDDWRQVDGSDVNDMLSACADAIEHLRARRGPAFLWIRMERLSSHTSSDDQKLYRSAEEMATLEKGDPIARLRDEMIAAGHFTQGEYEALDQEVKERVRKAYAEAERAADPLAEDLQNEVFGDAPVPSNESVLPPGKYRMGDTVNLTLRTALEREPQAVLFGQDIEDPKGGVFRLTKGLSKDFPARVHNSPLAESTILGVAAGLASYGKRPLFELQFIDFISPGWNQLVTNWSTLRWRSAGEWKCPAVLYAPCGAYLPGGSLWHSQTNEAQLAHHPGIRVVMPSTAEDAAGYLWSGLRAEDPTIILLPKHLLWVEQQCELPVRGVPFGKARHIAAGADVTLVGWGNTVEVCTMAMRDVTCEASADFFDLRSIVPWDREALADSVRRTGRLVVVQEDTENCSVGQMIISTLMSDPSVFARMKAPPALVSKGNVMIGYNPIIEFAALPDAERVAAAIRACIASDAGVLKDESGRKKEEGEPAHIAEAKRKVLGDLLLPPPAAAATSLQGQMEKARESAPAPAPTVAAPAPAAAPATPVEASAGGAVTLKVPILGEGIRAARIVALLKKPGEKIKADEPLCELETDKAVYPVEASGAGELQNWLVAIGDSVEIGSPLGTILAADPGAWGHNAAAGGGEGAPEVHKPKTPTGPQPALSPAITRRLVGVVPVSCSVQARFENVRQARRQSKARGSNVTPSLIAAWCIVRAVAGHESFRRELLADDTIRQNEAFDLGLAVALDGDRLVTAVIPEVAQLSWDDFSKAYAFAIDEARNGRIHAEIKAPVILTSLGGFGVRHGTPILVPPAVGTLFIGEAHWEMQPEGDGSWPVPQEVVTLSLTFDHRIVNGAGAAAFIQDVKKRLETFVLPG